eukprot:Gregarina_sp_Pseudo_9__1493@NODE_2002_length_1209_cov_72_060684_g1848_i0_p1_GENE_NODE_2002_length_1209_cov_72_060684_g1848_i0NODE_2002_length_1209_cov_72_060684_g1848_i0_p1_ORF_typecomplete_len328_score12_25zfSNAP50_C/PF12251_8/7_1e03zfSNAP50_C/PF12251_8/4_5e08DUF4428/PF14471_6/1_1e02DUF4428/PF14471_6/2_4_NODE_2002_length_1209_cov_72_060684_g1848_i01161099
MVSRSALQAFATDKLIRLLTNEPLQRIHAYSATTNFQSPTRFNRQPLRLRLPRFSCARQRPRVLVHSPDASPLSDYSLWRAQLYRSFNAFRRLGLHPEFLHDLRGALKAHQGLPLDRAVRRAKQKRLVSLSESASAALNTSVNISFEYTFCKPLSRTIEQELPFLIAARRDFLFHLLAVPLFSWPKSFESDPQKLPLLKKKKKNGEPLCKESETSSKFTVQDLIQIDARFVSFGSQLFEVKFTDTTRVLDSNHPYVINPQKGMFRKCEACKLHNAEVEASESLVLPITPGYLCKACYNELHPEAAEGSQFGLVELLTPPDPPDSTNS